jgi:hypothetical protein
MLAQLGALLEQVFFFVVPAHIALQKQKQPTT